MNPARSLPASAVVELWPLSASAANLSPEDAVGSIGKTATVCGVVAARPIRGQHALPADSLDFGKSSACGFYRGQIRK
jgi:hypothetical protein